MHFPPRLFRATIQVLLTTAAQFDLVSESLKKAVDERHASAQFLVAELAEQRKEPRRLNNRLLIATECFSGCCGKALQHLRIDGAEHFAKNQSIANRAHRFVRFGRVYCSLNQLVA